MDFTNEVLEDIHKKKEFNIIYSKYFYRLSKEYESLELPLRAKTIFNKHNRIHDCMNLWQWDLYRKNKVMDLIRVNRCMDNRFCPNCKKFSLASAIHNLRPSFKDLFLKGYKPYLVTLTIPSVTGVDLRSTIDKLNKAYTKFNNLLSKTGWKGFKNRFMTFDASLKVLEVTVNNITNMYHPHFHVMMFSDDEYDESLLFKDSLGPWSRKRESYNKYSEMDYQIMKLWKLCFDGVSCTSSNYSNLNDDWQELYQCDFKEMNEKGIYEVLKYTFKDTDIRNYGQFRNIFLGLEGKRIRQGYGLLYNVKLEDDANGEKQELELIEKENPEQLLTREIKTLITVYKDFKKISRFRSLEEFNKID